MGNASVSVVIPTYNNARYIGESIDSVLAQTHPPDEIFIVDDGSTDNTRDVVSTYTDRRIHYVPSRHGGISAARNKGISLASCEYLTFLDSDDLWRSTMLEKQIAMLKHDRHLVCSFTNFVRFKNDTGELLPDQFTFYPGLMSAALGGKLRCCGDGFILDGDPFVTCLQFHEIPAYMQCTVFRRSMISDMRLNESLRRCEDTEFVLRAFLRGKVAFIPEVLADVRRHNSNITKDISLIELDRLQALLSVGRSVDSARRRAALHDRTVKSRIDCANALIRAGRPVDGMRSYFKALTIPGSGTRKAKGLARTSYNILSSMAGGMGFSRAGMRANQRTLAAGTSVSGRPQGGSRPHSAHATYRRALPRR